MKLAIIPARGGSKRIPRKNIKFFHGKPIIAYSIEAALKSGCFDKVIVSTDDREIAQVAKKYGAEVPFIRPKELADDFATTASVIEHTLSFYETQKKDVSYVCCIYPTAPLLKSEDIVASYSRLRESEDAQFCFPVCDFSYPIQRALKLTDTNRIEMFQREFLSSRSQDLDEAYHDAGIFYWGLASAFINRLPVFSKYSVPYVIPRYRVIDIDTEDDWHIALKLYSVFRD